MFKKTHFCFIISIISIPCISTFILTLAIISEVSLFNYKYFMPIFITICIVYMNICICYLYFLLKSYFKKLASATTQNKVFKSELYFYKQLNQSQTELSAIKHDLKNQYLLLLGLACHDDTANIKRYLENALDSLKHTDNYYTEDYLLNFLINDKKNLADQHHIIFQAKVFLSKHSRLDSDILAILLGNLIDNAINALNRLPADQEKKINILIKQANHNLLIELTNRFDIREVTARKHRESAGIGIKNIKKIVHDHNGIYRQWVTSDIFHTSILLFDIYASSDISA